MIAEHILVGGGTMAREFIVTGQIITGAGALDMAQDTLGTLGKKAMTAAIIIKWRTVSFYYVSGIWLSELSRNSL